MSDNRGALRAYERHTRSTPAEVARVLDRFERRRAPKWPFFAATTMAMAAVTVAILLRPEPPILIPLAGDGTRVEIPPHVVLAVDGTGEVTGHRDDLAVRWDAGTLGVEVAPEQGVRLEVVTPEATVRVIGTVFDVQRDAYGTTVVVERGAVEVACTVGTHWTLSAGGREVCPPVTAAGLLGRARALQRSNEVEEILPTVDAALALDPAPEIEAELLILRLEMLVREERHDAALEAAGRYLATGALPRRPEIAALAADLAWMVGGCAAAAPYFEELAGDDASTSAAWRTCRP